MHTKFSKVILIWGVALHATLVVFNNITDYDSNFQFVRHVLEMDTTFPGNQAMRRAINSLFLHHAVYGLIILAEIVIAVLCWLGGLRLLRSISDLEQFNKAKKTAYIGLTLGITLWFTGFISVGGEWFLMWQSKTWNGQQAAFRLVVVLGIVLLYLNQTDGDNDA